jgi:F0F1-type ATP synthase membrane subunit b/b'
MRKQGITRMCCCVQSQLEMTKADYEERVQDIKREAEDLRTEIAGLQAAKAELESAQRNAENDIQQARDEAAQRVRQAQVGSTSHKYLEQTFKIVLHHTGYAATLGLLTKWSTAVFMQHACR